MKVLNAFPSKFLKCSDLEGEERTYRMQHVEMDKAGDDEKPVLYFSGEKKGLMLNKTNAKRITHLYGEESEDWIGKEIVLYPDMTDLRGEPVETIRVRGPIKKSTDRKPKAAEPEFDNERYPIRD